MLAAAAQVPEAVAVWSPERIRQPKTVESMLPDVQQIVPHHSAVRQLHLERKALQHFLQHQLAAAPAADAHAAEVVPAAASAVAAHFPVSQVAAGAGAAACTAAFEAVCKSLSHAHPCQAQTVALAEQGPVEQLQVQPDDQAGYLPGAEAAALAVH